MRRPSWVPEEIDLSVPNAARVYDYYLGGNHHFAVDREMGEKAIALWPELPEIIQANRRFLRRAVRWLAESGVRQFLDLGSGIPTAGNVHETARQAAHGTRVVYVDQDPVVISHARQLLADDPDTVTIKADLRDPAELLRDPDLGELLDFSEPVAVLMFAVLHFVPDDADPAGLVSSYASALSPGSYLALSHASDEGHQDKAASHVQLYRQTATPMTMRTHTQIMGLLNGFEMVEPGLVHIPLWRPEPGESPVTDPSKLVGYGGVARLAR